MDRMEGRNDRKTGKKEAQTEWTKKTGKTDRQEGKK